MGLFITDPLGLIIAFLNVTTFLLLVYVLLQAMAEGRSRVLRVLDRVFAPLLAPLRRIVPEWKIDIASLILAIVLQLIAFALKSGYR
jgi:uncharacterized protein YggT (Ycf19 family)